MIHRNRLWALSVSATLALCAAPGLRADEAAPSTAPTSTAEEIKALRVRLDQLEAQQKEAEQKRQAAEEKLNEKIAAEDLKVESNKHDNFITAEGFTAGYSDGRFIIQSADGNFVLRPWAHFQFRAIANEREGFQGNKIEGSEDEWNLGFEVRRIRFGFDGNMFSPDFTYFFNWTTSRTSSNATVSGATPSKTGGAVTVSNNLGGVPILEEAWVKYHIPTSDFYLKAGQMHDPLLHEETVSSRYRHSAEISLTGDIFANGDAFTEATTLIYDPNSFIRFETGINHGLRGANTNFYSYPDNGSFNQFDYGVAGRAEYKVMGTWKDYGQVGAVGDKEPLLVFGVGADYSERGHDGQVVAVVDGMYGDQNGIFVYGSFVDRYTTHNFGYYTQTAAGASINAGNPAVAGTSTNEYSVLLEGGYIIAERIEPFGRYEYIKLQGTPPESRNYIEVVTAGVNYYFHGHRLKLTGEIEWLPQGIPFDDTPTDIVASPHGGEIVYEIQLQLLL